MNKTKLQNLARALIGVAVMTLGLTSPHAVWAVSQECQDCQTACESGCATALCIMEEHFETCMSTCKAGCPGSCAWACK